MKKIVSLVLALVLALSLAACGGKNAVTLDKSEHTFTAAGETLQLTADTKADTLTWTSSDEAVATVDANGLITAVAPGTAVITVTAGDATATCTVTCDWVVVIDLEAFYTDLYDTLYPLDEEGYSTGPWVEDWAAMEEIPEILDTYYPGLFDLELNQAHIYIPGMTAVAYEVTLIEVANDADVDAAKAILQSRIDNQINNHHNYPMVIEAWQTSAQILTHGRYLMLVAGDDAAAYADAFNALF